MFDEDKLFDGVHKFRPIPPEKLVTIVAGEKNAVLGGLHSSFFISSEHEDSLREPTERHHIETFLGHIQHPYRGKLNLGALPAILDNPVDRDQAYSMITKRLTSGVLIEGGRFKGDREKAKFVAKKIMICYPGLSNVYTSEGLSDCLFPVGLKAESSFILSWKKACGVITFLGWD